MLLGGAPFKIRSGHVGRFASEIVNGHQRAADNSMTDVHALHPKQRSIRRGVKVGEHTLVRICPAAARPCRR